MKQRIMSIINIVIAVILAFLAFRILIMNGLSMNIMAVLLAIITIGAMIEECTFLPNKENFLKKILILIASYFLIYVGLNVVLPKTSLSLDTLMYYRYFIYLLIASFIVNLIGFFILTDKETTTSANTSKADEQAKLAKLKYQQQLKQEQMKQKQAKKQRKARKRKVRKVRGNRKGNNKKPSQLQAKINADRAKQAQQSLPQQNSNLANNNMQQTNNQPPVSNNTDDEIL